jgi:hypothetical protein
MTEFVVCTFVSAHFLFAVYGWMNAGKRQRNDHSPELPEDTGRAKRRILVHLKKNW